MPVYEYECEKCGEHFDLIQKFSDEPVTVHEKCGGPVHRLISAPALQFKGSGWYVTDYAKNSGSGSEKGGKAAATSSDKKTDKPSGGSESNAGSSSESKPDTKSSTPDSK